MELGMVLRTRVAHIRGLGDGGNGANKGHHDTSAAPQVPDVFFSARIGVPHECY
jgi:hypothetical protein